MVSRRTATLPPAQYLARSTRGVHGWRSVVVEWAAPILAVFAPLLGGASAVWSQGVIFIALGILLVLSPPRRTLGTTCQLPGGVPHPVGGQRIPSG